MEMPMDLVVKRTVEWNSVNGVLLVSWLIRHEAAATQGRDLVPLLSSTSRQAERHKTLCHSDDAGMTNGFSSVEEALCI